MNWIAISGSIIAGLATGAGALPIFLKKEYSKNTLDIGLGFSAGIMLVASFVSLIIPGLEQAKQIYDSQFSIFSVFLGLLAGYLFIIFIHEFLPHEHLHKNIDMNHQAKMSRVSLIVLAIALHNFPEGLAVGVGFGAGDESSGIALALAISLQNIPEGLIVAIGLLREGSTRRKAFFMALFSGLIEPIAALFGYFSTTFSRYSLPISLGFAGGTMLFVICQEIFPELFRQGHEKKATIGVISGVIIMLLIDQYVAS